MQPWEAALAYIIGPGVVGVGTWFAARIAATGARYAADKSADADEGAQVLTGYHQLVENLQTEVTRLGEKVARLDSRVEYLTTQERRDKALIRNLIAYVRRLIETIHQLGGEVPDPPGGIDFDDPEPLPPRRSD